MSSKHIADGEAEFVAISVTPDFCVVDGKVVPYAIARDLSHMKVYATSVRARGELVLKRFSIISGVVGNAGSGVLSGVSQGAGDVQMLEGSESVRVEGQPTCRHLDACLMNGK